MEYDAGSSGDFQRSTRMPLDAVVRLHFEGTVAYQNGFAANVSATGMFVKHPAPPPIGTPLVFEFNLGQQRKPVQGAGEVVWVRDRYLGPGQPAGIGIRFAQLDTQSRDHIAEALFDFLERSLAEDSYFDTQRLAGQIGAPAEELAVLQAPRTPQVPAPRDTPAKIDLASVARLPSAGSTPYEDDRSTAPMLAVSASRAAEALPIDDVADPGSAFPPQSSPERPPFAVFSPLDSADANTAAIVREALRDEATPAFAGAASSRRQRSSNGWIWAALALVAAAAAGWFAWQRWGPGVAEAPAVAAPEPAPPAPVEPVRPQPEPLSAEPSPGTLAESVGIDTRERSAAANPPSARPTSPTAAAEPEEAEPSDVEAARAPASQTVAEPIAAADTPAETVAPAAPVATPARALTAITTRDGAASGATEILIAANGSFAPGTFSYSEIGGENPRVLIKLRGMESPFRGASSGSSARLRGVRTGFHLTGKGNEIHVVVDLAPPAAKVISLEPTSEGLLLRLAGN